MPYSSAPSMAATTTSRPVLMPPSVRSSTLSRRRLSVSTWCVSDRPISQGMPAYLMLVCGLAPVPPAVAGDQDHVGLGLGDAGRDGADAGPRHQLHGDPRLGVDLLQVVDQLRQILDRVDVVMRRRADQRHARRRMTQLGDHLADLEARQLAALAGLGALGHLDLELAAVVEVLRRDAEAARRHLLDGRRGVVAVGARPIARRILAAFARIGLRPDAVHGDRQRLVRLRSQRAQRDAGRHQALAQLGDRFDLVEGNRRAVGLEVQQVAQVDGRQAPHLGAVAPVLLVGLGGDRVLQHVDEVALEIVPVAAAPHLVEAADRQRDHVLVEGALVLLGDLLLHAAQADARDARRHAGEEFLDQRARQADRLEVAAAAVGRQHRDAHLGHDLQQAVVQRLLVVGQALPERELAEQAALVAGRDRLLGEVGVHRGGADADDDGGIVHVQALGRAHVERDEGAQATGAPGRSARRPPP